MKTRQAEVMRQLAVTAANMRILLDYPAKLENSDVQSLLRKNMGELDNLLEFNSTDRDWVAYLGKLTFLFDDTK